MKKLIVFILIASIQIVHAQESQKVTEDQKSFSKGNHTAFSVKIPRAKQKTVVSDWKKYLQKNNKAKFTEVNGEYHLSKTIINEISPDSVIIYSIISSKDSSVEVDGFLCSNDSTFQSSSTSQELSTKFSTYMRNFAVSEYRIIVTGELSIEQKKLKELEGQLSDLEESNEQSQKKISSNKRENEKSEDEIKNNLRLKELKSDAIFQQQKILATFSESSDRKKEEEKKLKSMEKEKHKLDNASESMHNDIDRNESENKNLQKKIDKNTNELIPQKKSEIEKQTRVVSETNQILNDIK